ncbi:hypothetical protein GDO86_019379, partial [Hymenochirus boettgeri]
FKDTMENVVGHRVTEQALQRGQMFSASEALKVGLVDQLMSEEKVQSTRSDSNGTMVNSPRSRSTVTKSMMRKQTIEDW